MEILYFYYHQVGDILVRHPPERMTFYCSVTLSWANASSSCKSNENAGFPCKFTQNIIHVITHTIRMFLLFLEYFTMCCRRMGIFTVNFVFINGT